MLLKTWIISPLYNAAQHIRLAPKMLLMTVLVGFIVWAVVDNIQTEKLKQLSNMYIDKVLEERNHENRIRFDNYVESYNVAARLIVQLHRFRDYVSSFNTSRPGKHAVKSYSELPSWMPDASVMRHLAHIHLALLLDQKGRLKELYQYLPGQLPHALLEPSGLVLKLSHNQSFMTTVEGRPFLLTSESLTGANGEVEATLMLVAALDSDLLKEVTSEENRNNIVALIENTKNQVIASNKPELVPERTFAEKLEKNYRISGKTFFDQGSSDLTVGFATLMPRSEIEKITATAISSERLISSIMALSLILSFSLIIFMITRHIRQLNTRVNAFSENTLKIKVPGRQKGDELLALEKEFVNLSRAITEARDIMKRQADELLSEKTVYLNNIMQSSPMAIAATDLNFVIKYYNPVAEKFFGHTADEVVGRAVPHIHEKLKVDPSRFERAIEIVKQGKIYLYNVEVKTESGVRFLESRVSGILDDGGKLIGFVLMSSDVTDKIKAEEKIKTLAKFPDENPYPVLRISLEGVLSYSNKASAPLLDLWGCSSSGTVPEHLRQLISQILESGDEREIELAVDERFFSLIIVPVADEGYVNMYGRDVSLKKQMEEKLRTYSLELERSNKELELFASIAAHDLQEPLRGVSGFAGLLKKRYMGKLDQDGDEFISYIVDGAERMQQLIRDLLAYSRVTTSGKAFTPVDCNNAVRAALDNLRISIDESGSVITFKPLPVVNADKGQIIRLFQNLIGNAIKYRGDSKPAIAVSAEKQGDEWVFSVADNGIGIDAQYYARIFQIFQRLHKRDEYPGTGIGLSVCKRIIERHGGRIWVESTPGKGSVFYFTIPAG